jgi:hypothetical protein
MSRNKTNGRFDTRKELEEYVLHLWFNTSTGQTKIAKNCEVSPGTVSSIILEAVLYKNKNNEIFKKETEDEKRMLNVLQNGNDGDHYE